MIQQQASSAGLSKGGKTSHLPPIIALSTTTTTTAHQAPSRHIIYSHLNDRYSLLLARGGGGVFHVRIYWQRFLGEKSVQINMDDDTTKPSSPSPSSQPVFILSSTFCIYSYFEVYIYEWRRSVPSDLCVSHKPTSTCTRCTYDIYTTSECSRVIYV